MKLYIVCKVWNSEELTPSVVAHFATESDAEQYAKLSRQSDIEHKYAVYKLICCTK